MVEMLVSGLFCFVLDQSAKRLVELRAADRVYRAGPVAVRQVMSHKNVYRYRSVRRGMTILWVAAFLSGLLLAGSTFGTSLSLAAIGAALGGALGNLRDILTYGSVRDFIDLGWWPVFNLADVAIVAGLPIAFIAR